MTPLERATTAHHESGHAVAFLHYGIPFESVSVLLDPAPGEHWGRVHVLAHSCSPLHQAAAFLAGPAAEAAYTGEPVTALFASTCRSDRRMALDALACDGTPFAEALQRARDLVRQEWRRIAKLARALVLVETLDATEVRRVLRPGSSPARACPPADQRWSLPAFQHPAAG